ncbi:hypothetical protein LQK89_02590 [Curtobacterium sp. C1]|uniref:hypothetical protein n=1 Tax=Curtobacterium sp. C1 TaxID=2898151 RepID=UPI001E52ACD6|nr:hypothetical protein [Curtobacterium sp. C1]UFU14606.1 hypothetical protein LQK89_02590 [Curtobacterium sp. C1]
MKKDTRLWMKFPISFPDHPKIRPLSDAAFRAFVELNAYSREQDLDGRVPIRAAKAKWKVRALKELETNHPERPTLTIDGDVYVIHNYAEHQDTIEDREAREARNRTNGARGGRPRKNRTETDSVTNSGTDPEPGKNQSQSQSQSQKPLTDVTYLPESSPVGDRAHPRTDLSEEIIAEANRAGVPDLEAVLAILEPIVGPLNPRHGVELARVILRRAKSPVRDPTAYIARAAERRDEIVHIAVDVLDLPGVAA